ncbi:hypothetical protein [Streptomyces sp. NPDC045714]|uniref:hypothetical protein n=1 Tax=Streptomyces sp. NPDC045714 TaxID=3154913 RepID=UPI0033E2377F
MTTATDVGRTSTRSMGHALFGKLADVNLKCLLRVSVVAHTVKLQGDVEVVPEQVQELHDQQLFVVRKIVRQGVLERRTRLDHVP